MSVKKRQTRRKKGKVATDHVKNNIRHTPAPTSPQTIFHRHRWALRVTLAVLSPLLLLGSLELILGLAGVGYPTGFFLRSTVAGKQVWVENPKYGWRFFPRRLTRRPGAMAIPCNREPNLRRVFILGESAAYGDPRPDYGFPRFLEILLRSQASGERFEVINAAMTAINSHVIVPIARDCAVLSAPGDVWVLYIGNNEVVGPFGPGTVFGMQTPNPIIVHSQIRLKSTRLGQCLDVARQRWQERSLGAQRWSGMEMFTDKHVRQNDPQMLQVYDHFRSNLNEIVNLGLQAGVKIILCTVAVNLKDCAPFASLHRLNLTDAQQNQWNQHFSAGKVLEKSGETQDAVHHYLRAARLDNTYAELLYRLARCALQNGKEKEAAKFFTQARDADALRFRADSRINQSIRQIGTHHLASGVCLLDVETLFAAQSPVGIPGRDYFYEHVHFTIEGNYHLALAVAKEVVLPKDRIRDRWFTSNECAERLGLSNWSHLVTLELVRRRLKDAPFTNQYNHHDQSQQLEERIEKLKTTLTPESLASAVSNHRRMLTQVPEDWVLWKNLAMLLNKTDDLTGVLESLKQVLDRVPNYAEAWCDLGRCYYRLGQIDLSRDAYQRALQIWPNLARALCGLGMIHVEEGELTKASEHFEAALNIQPAMINAHLGLARVLDQRGEAEEALVHLQKISKLDPDNVSAKSLLQSILNRSGQLNQVITHYTKQLARNPNDITAHLKLGDALSVQGKSEEAAKHYWEAVRVQPNLVKARLCLGLELANHSKTTEAMEQFSEALRLEPDNVEAHFYLGTSLAILKRFAEAVEHFETALRLNPDDDNIKKYLQMARIGLGKTSSESRN